MIGAMPYKQKVFPICDEVDEMGLRKIGSVNTIVHRDGRLKANTDGIGFFRSLPPFSIKGKTRSSAASDCQQAIHLGVKRILVYVGERLVHYRSVVQLIEDGFDFS